MKKAIIIYLIFLGLALALYGTYCWSYNPRSRWGDALLIEEMDSICLPDTLRSEEYANLMNRIDHDNYTAVIYFQNCLSDSAIRKLDSLVDISNRYSDGYDVWCKSCDTTHLIPNEYITDSFEWIKSKNVLYYHFSGGLDASVTYWIYDDMMIADAESSQFPNRLLDVGFVLLLVVFLHWVLILGYIKLLKFFKREDKKTISNYKMIVESVSSVFDKYATGSGRASRSEYWWWTLFVIIALYGAGILDVLIGSDSVSIFYGILNLVLFLPNICVSIRRCHDSGHSGWWVICPIVNLIMMFLPSDPVVNEYGAPEGEETE